MSSESNEEDRVPRYLEVCTGDGGVDGEALHSFKRRAGKLLVSQKSNARSQNLFRTCKLADSLTNPPHRAV